MPNSVDYKMTITLNVLNNLGITLYSNVPAVLSEVVANSWDADATKVDIEIKSDNIIITDDGDGMTHEDINDKYLKIGYQRRKGKEDVLTTKGRTVMGRKGIGKLSLLSIANNVSVETVKGEEKNGFVMSVNDIKNLIENDEHIDYKPVSLLEDEITLNKKGTRIILTELQKGVYQTPNALRKRLARRFSIIGSDEFDVIINGESVTAADRDYFHNIQYIWYFGDKSKQYVNLCKKRISHKLEKNEKRNDIIEIEREGTKVSDKVRGWIGSVNLPQDLKSGRDNLNKIAIMVRGKLAQEDILEDFTEARVYTKYLIGEIHADFLDIDTEQDIATSNRQDIIKNEPRYKALQEWVDRELKYIANQWTLLRNLEGVKDARKLPAVAEWMDGMSKDQQRIAHAMFGKINQLNMDDEEYRINLYRQCVLIFEKLKQRKVLDKLESVSAEDIPVLTDMFSSVDEIEAYLYYEIVLGRLDVINKFRLIVSDNDKERIIQKYLYDHLWLLDPSWDRATETPSMEQNVKKAFADLDPNDYPNFNPDLDDDKNLGRVDIQYKKASGKHIIIELKRASIKLSQYKLQDQVSKYQSALEKLLSAAGKKEPIEVICIVGKKLVEWEVSDARMEQSKSAMAMDNTRVVLYNELIENAFSNYQAYLEKSKEANRLYELINNITTAIKNEADKDI